MIYIDAVCRQRVRNVLGAVIQAAGDAVTLLRNLQAGPNVYPGVPPDPFRSAIQLERAAYALLDTLQLDLVRPLLPVVLRRIAKSRWDGFH